MLRVLPSLAQFTRGLLQWYDQSQRKLPWRRDPSLAGQACGLDPYYVLVSESMLQQTQVATVIPYFNRFIARFPTLADLAAANEQDVLRLWQGLGYYSRARNLQAAAKKVLSEYNGQLPPDADELLKLPGVGRYTAGAVASIAFERRAPILDGNVARVLCRIDRISTAPRDRETRQLLWRRAEEVLPRKRVGDFNSALMELGATVCTPRSPQCLICPVREHCEAFAAGLQEKIPAPREAKPTPLLHRHTFCMRRGNHWLIERRPQTGRWAGLWQFPTRDPNATLSQEEKLSPLGTSSRRALGVVTHALTHRRYHFDVFLCEVANDETPLHESTWATLDGLDPYPLPRPHLKIVEMLRELEGSDPPPRPENAEQRKVRKH